MEKEKGGNQGKKKKACKPNSGTSSPSSSWQDRITFDAKEDSKRHKGTLTYEETILRTLSF